MSSRAIVPQARTSKPFVSQASASRASSSKTSSSSSKDDCPTKPLPTAAETQKLLTQLSEGLKVNPHLRAKIRFPEGTKIEHALEAVDTLGQYYREQKDHPKMKACVEARTDQALKDKEVWEINALRNKLAALSTPAMSYTPGSSGPTAPMAGIAAGTTTGSTTGISTGSASTTGSTTMTGTSTATGSTTMTASTPMTAATPTTSEPSALSTMNIGLVFLGLNDGKPEPKKDEHNILDDEEYKRKPDNVIRNEQPWSDKNVCGKVMHNKDQIKSMLTW